MVTHSDFDFIVNHHALVRVVLSGVNFTDRSPTTDLNHGADVALGQDMLS